MANTKSAKKAVRSSNKKKIHNLGWKKRIKTAIRNFTDLVKSAGVSSDLNKSLSMAQKALDKAAKENVIHKNKANRLKSKLAVKLNSNAKSATSKSTKSSK
jgi:small subunit ribosomal protein S20